MKLSFRSIRLRVALVAATAALTTMLAAGALAWSLGLAEDRIAAALATQRRLDLWSAVSGRISDYTFMALEAAGGNATGAARLTATRSGVATAFQDIDQALNAAIAEAPGDSAKAAAANRGRLLARLRAGFEVLDRQIGERIAAAGPETADQIRGALNGFAVTFGPNLSAIMDDERRTAGRILDDMRALRHDLTIAAVFGVLLALLVGFWLYRGVLRAVLLRISDMAAMAAAIGRGDLRARLAVTGRDELSLAMAGFNRMAGRLERREAAVVAERARLEQTVAERTADLTAANAELAAVDASRRRFFTDVSHELRTPLTVILGECDLALRKLDRAPDPGLAEPLATIRNRAQRLHRRVEDLLRVARSDTGELDLVRTGIPVASLIREAVEGTANLARRAGIAVVVEAPGDVGAFADPEWMRQVVEGLIANAIRHAPAGSAIRVTAREEGDQAMLSVADSGSGIPAADLPHVFERFYRGAGSLAGSGFGIGLALARWVVERHGGRIAIESRTDPAAARGTTVTIRLPAADVTPAGRPPL